MIKMFARYNMEWGKKKSFLCGKDRLNRKNASMLHLKKSENHFFFSKRKS